MQRSGDGERELGTGARTSSDRRVTLELDGGRLRCRTRRRGPAVVFVHGLLVNANLWRKVVAAARRLHARGARHAARLARRADAGDADSRPPTSARLIGEAVEALGLEDVTLVGNDTGGALCQIAVRSGRRGSGGSC